MPYQRRYKKKKYSNNSHGRPGYVRCGKMVISDASKALSMVKALKVLVNVEKKNHDIATAIGISTTPTILEMTNILQGDTTLQRDGSQCKIISIMVRYLVTQHVTAVSTTLRVMIIHDKQTNQAIYTAADLLVDVTANDALNSPRNLDNMKRFSVLYDRVHSLSDSGRTTSNHRFYKNCNILLRFDNAAAAITSLTQSSISLLLVSNEATNVPNVNIFTRLRFVDN